MESNLQPPIDKKRNSLIPVVIFIIFIFASLFGAGMTYLVTNDSRTSEPDECMDEPQETSDTECAPCNDNNAPDETDESNENRPLASKYVSTDYSLTYILRENCIDHKIDLDLLPLEFKDKPDDVSCTVIDDKVTDLTLYFENDNSDIDDTASVHDKYSFEFGHGGPSYLGHLGTVLAKGNDYEITYFVVLPEMTAAIPDELDLYIRARKILDYKDGDRVFVNRDYLVFNAETDEKFKNWLKENVSTEKDGLLSVNTTQAQREILDKYFSDLNNLDGKPAEIYNEAMTFLESIEAKEPAKTN